MSLVSIPDFPEYDISVDGKVYNRHTGRCLSISKNPRGHAKVTLFRDKQPHTITVSRLVAEAYVHNPYNRTRFDTPIHLDHDLLNNHASNLLWRPRWFAIKYRQQVRYDNYQTHANPILDPTDGKTLYGYREVCEKHGVYWYEVMRSCLYNEPVFPDWLIFCYDEKW